MNNGWPVPRPATIDKDFKDRVQALMDSNRRVLNRVEQHLGCVTCRGAIVDGRCLACDPLEGEERA